jgi:hypothetical protein
MNYYGGVVDGLCETLLFFQFDFIVLLASYCSSFGASLVIIIMHIWSVLMILGNVD